MANISLAPGIWAGISPEGWAIASGALLAALVARLVDKGVLSNTDAEEIVAAARAGVGSHSGRQIAVHDALRFLDSLKGKPTG
jgi:hypothetical protein